MALLLLALSLLMVGSKITVHAATVMVPQNSLTIQGAINMANPNDTILVSAGNYPERLVISKPLHLLGASKENTVIDGQGMGTVVWVNSSNVEIRGFTVKDPDQYGWSIHVEKSNHVNITSNAISAGVDGDGVNLFKANFTVISSNVFSNNLYAVNVTSSDSERILNNRADVGDVIGVQLLDSRGSLVFNNTFSGGEYGLDLVSASFNNITRNVVREKSLAGILFSPESPSTPPSQFSGNNTVVENTFEGNHFGVDMQNATLNTFYHNGFFVSGLRHVILVATTITSPNFWDNRSLGGVRGGNYWDDYAGSDMNGDGIGDTNLPADGVDQYPLMSPFAPVPVFIVTLVPSPANGTVPLTVNFTASVLGSLTPLLYHWDFGDGSTASGSSSVNHMFSRGGNFTVLLTVTDSTGSSFSRSTSVLAGSIAVVQPDSYTVPLIVAGVVLGGLAGLLFWRRRKRRNRAEAVKREATTGRGVRG